MYDLAFIAQVLPRVRTTLVTALSPLVDSRVYWQRAPWEATYPHIVLQSQDNGGKRADYVGANGWQGFITIRVVDTDPDSADTLLADVPALVRSLPVIDYTLSLIPDSPLQVFPEELSDTTLFTAVLICAAFLA